MPAYPTGQNDPPDSLEAPAFGRSPSDFDIGMNVVVSASVLDAIDIGSIIGLDDDNHHHLARVVRLRTDDHITLTDGLGRWVGASVKANFMSAGLVGVTSAVHHVAEPEDVGVAFALTKGDKPETVVQKLTELGVRRIIPIRAFRSVVRWDLEKADRNRVRLDAVARGALAQCRGAWLPVIEPIVDVVTLAQRVGVVRADRGGRPLGPTDRIIAIGPEGGWSPEERGILAEVVGLPGSVLRAETAAIIAAALLVGR